MLVMDSGNFLENDEANVFKIWVELNEIIVLWGFVGLSEKDIDENGELLFGILT